MAADKQATFGIKVQAESNALEAANDIETLRRRIAASQDAVRNYSSAMKSLRGASDEVKEAKGKLKAAVDAERDSISRASLELGKAGKTFRELTKHSHDAAHGVSSAKYAMNAAAGPVAGLKYRFMFLKDMLNGTNVALGLTVFATALAVAGIVKLTEALYDAGKSMGEFVLKEANILRTQDLFRQAALMGAENAKNMGDQIEYMGDRIPTSRKELNDLSIEMGKLFAGTHVTKDVFVDTFRAISGEAAAMGDGAGKALQTIIDRGKQWGRVGMGLFELQGTGLDFGDIAQRISKNMGISLMAAVSMLRTYRVPIGQAAKAIREAVEKQFGAINKARLLDLDVIALKFKDDLALLTKDVNLQPMLEQFAKLEKLFDRSTISGVALKELVTFFGDQMGAAFKFLGPLAETFFYQLEIEALKFENDILDVELALRKAFGKDALNKILDEKDAIFAAKYAFDLFKYSVEGLMLGVAALGVSFAVLKEQGRFLVAMWEGAVELFDDVSNSVQKVVNVLDLLVTAMARVHGIEMPTDITKIGTGVGKGFEKGVIDATSRVKDASNALAGEASKAFTKKMEIHSPSKVFERHGAQMAAGLELGMNRGAPDVSMAAADMGPKPSAGGAANNTNTITVNLKAEFPNAKDGPQVAAALQSASFRASFTKMFEEFARGQGVPTQ